MGGSGHKQKKRKFEYNFSTDSPPFQPLPPYLMHCGHNFDLSEQQGCFQVAHYLNPLVRAGKDATPSARNALCVCVVWVQWWIQGNWEGKLAANLKNYQNHQSVNQTKGFEGNNGVVRVQVAMPSELGTCMSRIGW